MADHAHDHEHADDGLGLLVGVRILEDEGELFLAEAEIGPYVDDPDSLGVTLVFHPLADLDPTTDEGDEDRPTYTFDFDDELTRDEKAPLRDQAQAIFRQLAKLPEESLREYLRVAREEYGIDDEDEAEG